MHGEKTQPKPTALFMSGISNFINANPYLFKHQAERIPNGNQHRESCRRVRKAQILYALG